MRVTSAFSRLVRLPGVWVKKVRFQPDRVIVEVALRRRRLQCPRCQFSTAARKDTRPVHSIWRHLDLGVWRLEIHCRRRRLRCPRHGVLAEGVPFARHRSGFTRDFECLVAWLAARTDKTAITRMLRIDWDTVGRIVTRVCADELDPDRLAALFDIGVDEVSWKKQHNYLTLVADHRAGKIVWGCPRGRREGRRPLLCRARSRLTARRRATAHGRGRGLVAVGPRSPRRRRARAAGRRARRQA